MAKQTKIPLWLDYSLNQYNGQSLSLWHENGAVGATLSPELTMAQVEHLAGETPIQLECLVQGPLEMMVSEYCVPGSFVGNISEGKCSFNCKEETFLKDRKDELFPLMHDQFGRTHILNGHDLSVLTSLKQIEAYGITRLRIDARSYSAVETERIVALYRQVLNKDIVVEENIPHTTRGHYFRGVL
jgi:putative protease